MNKILIVVDLQKDFAYQGGSLSNSFCEEVAKKVAEYIKTSDANLIYATLDTHPEDYLESTLEGKNLPVKHCIKNTDGHRLVPEVEEALTKFTKGSFYLVEKNTFGFIDWRKLFEDGRVDSETVFEICGVCTSICVAANAIILRALYPNNEIRVLKNLCACVSYPSHKAALKTMEMQQITIV